MKPRRILIRRTSLAPEQHIVHTQPVARQLLLHLHRMGVACFPIPWAGMPNQKPGAILFWILAGQGRLVVDNKLEIRLRPEPCFYLFGSSQKRLFEPDNGQAIATRSFWFGGPGLDAWLEHLRVNTRPQFHLPHPQQVFQAYARMQRLIHDRPPNWELNVHFIISAVLAELLRSREVLTSGRPTLPGPIERAINVVATNPAKDWQVVELAAVVGMSDRAFRALFQASMNEPPHTYIQRVRVELARNMLLDKRLLIKEIAGKLHFSNEHYFSSFFHRLTGMTPTQFRQLLAKTPQLQSHAPEP